MAATKMITVLLLLSSWTEVIRANSAIASFRVNISDSDLLPFLAPGEAIDGSGQSCPNDDDTFSIPDPGWPDQSNGIGNKSPVRQRYSPSNYLISSGEFNQKHQLRETVGFTVAPVMAQRKQCPSDNIEMIACRPFLLVNMGQSVVIFGETFKREISLW